ncbi:MAG: hypothetical protein H6825_04055 [Planctomycetes bacterium]|nr:hypothetical protein [Planctomycetota bacterium]
MRRPVLCALLVSALLMSLSLAHGLPQRYVPDDHVVRCALGIARDVSAAEGASAKLAALVPPAGRYTTYPYLLPYVDLGALAATYMGGRALGAWGGAGPFREAVFENPGLAWLPGRIVSVLLALLLPWAAAKAARELGRPRGEAALAALLAGTSLLVVQYAHTTRPWAPMVGFGAASLAFALAFVRARRGRDALLCCVSAGCAGATLQVGLLFLAVPLTACAAALPGAHADGGADAGKRLLRTFAAALFVGVCVLVLVGWPHTLVHGGDTGSGAIADPADQVSLELGGQAFKFDIFGGALLRPTLRAWLLYDPVLVLLGALGVVMLLRVAPRGPVLLLVLAPAVLFAGLFLLYDGTHVRYLMPATPFLALGAARVLAALAARGGAARALALALLALPLVQCARLDWLLAQEDTRDLAAAAIPGLVPAGTTIAVDGMGSYYGPPLRPTAASLRRVAAAGVWLNRQEQRVIDLADAGVPEPEDARDLLPIQRFWTYDSYYPTDYVDPSASGASPPTTLDAFARAWDVGAYVQVDRLPDPARRQPVTDFTASRAELLWEASPTGRSAPREASLPTDMGAALTDLWTYERPGPWVRVWGVRPETPR